MPKKVKKGLDDKADAASGDEDMPGSPADSGVEATIVVGTYEGALLGVRASDGVQIFGFAPHTGCVKTIGTDAQGRLASGGTDHAVRLFDLAKGIEMGEIQEHDDTVSCVEYWSTTTMVSASEDGQVCLWSCHAWDMLKKFRAHKSAITCIAVHPSGRLMASAAKDKTVRLWDLTRATSAANLSADGIVEVMDWSPSGDLLSVLTSKELLVVTANDGSVAKFKDPNSSGFTRVPMCAVVMLRDDVVVVGDATGTLLALAGGRGATELTLKCSLPQAVEGTPRSRVKALTRPTPGGGQGIDGVFLAGMSSGRVEVWRLTGEAVSVESFSLLRTVETGTRLTALGAWGALNRPAKLGDDLADGEASAKVEAHRKKKKKKGASVQAASSTKRKRNHSAAPKAQAMP